jgi:hypothetical protein
MAWYTLKTFVLEPGGQGREIPLDRFTFEAPEDTIAKLVALKWLDALRPCSSAVLVGETDEVVQLIEPPGARTAAA